MMRLWKKMLRSQILSGSYRDEISGLFNPKAYSKSRNIIKIIFFRKINGVSYRIYFNSCNLEHVLFNELKDFTDDEKADMADDFAEKYEGKVEDFIEFISQDDLIAPGTFKQTWQFIEKEKHSLERFANMHLIFK